MPTNDGSLQVRREVIGLSSEGNDVELFLLGHGPQTVLIGGGIHGGYEYNSTQLVQQLLDTFIQYQDLIPASLTLAIAPAQNPDGTLHGVRPSVNGVDLNRNWPTTDWSPDANNQYGQLTRGLGGPEPLSEPETRAMHKWVLENQPVGFISYHSAAGIVYSGANGQALYLHLVYGSAAGYSSHDFDAYPVTGDFLQWIDDDTGVPGVEIELTTHTAIEFSRHLAGVLAVLPIMAQAPTRFDE